MSFDKNLMYAEGQQVTGITATLSTSSVDHKVGLKAHLLPRVGVEVVPTAVAGTVAGTKFELLTAAAVDGNGDVTSPVVAGIVEVTPVAGEAFRITPSRALLRYSQVRMTGGDATTDVTFDAGWNAAADDPE